MAHSVQFKQKSTYYLKFNIPNVIKYHFSEVEDHFVFLVMDIYDADLSRLLMPNLRLQELEITLNKIDIFYKIIDGLSHLHSIGVNIIHRDLKPSNILFKRNSLRSLSHEIICPAKNYEIVLADFGSAKEGKHDQSVISLMPETIAHRPNHESAQQQYGTEGWMAPEFIKHIANPSAIKINKNIDVFSAGAIFYFVLTGTHPFGSSNHSSYNILNNNSVYTNNNITALDNINKFRLSLNLRTQPVDNSNLENRQDKKYILNNLIQLMIHQDPLKRPPSDIILNHPLFWSDKKKCQFLIDLSNCLESLSIGEYTNKHKTFKIIHDLEFNSIHIFKNIWSDYFQSCPEIKQSLSKNSNLYESDPDIVKPPIPHSPNTVNQLSAVTHGQINQSNIKNFSNKSSKQIKYNVHSLLSLIRSLRNKSLHPEDDLDFKQYFLKFPTLIINTWTVLLSYHSIDLLKSMQEYFPKSEISKSYSYADDLSDNFNDQVNLNERLKQHQDSIKNKFVKPKTLIEKWEYRLRY